MPTYWSEQNPLGLKCFVYFNLHRKVWSIKALEGPNKGRVIAHSKMIEMSDCTLKVSEAGRQRVLREKRKNVHAGVVGIVRTIGEQQNKQQQASLRMESASIAYGRHPIYSPISYNPHKYSTFVQLSTGEPVTAAPWVFLNANLRVVGASRPTI